MDDDRAIVERQIGRPPRAFRSVAVRCPFGRPAITEQAAFDESGEPFPTTFYVTCRHLVAAIARLEAAGGVARWSRLAQEDPALRESAQRAHAEQLRLRPELPGGIGGQTRAGGLKCLHAHAAFALARPGYELGERIVAEVEPLWPARCCYDGRSGEPEENLACAVGPPCSPRRRARFRQALLVASPAMPTVLETTRYEWQEGHRRLQAAAADRPRYTRLLREVDIVLEELRRRVGQRFTLDELAAAYGQSDRWAQEAVAERDPAPGWPARVATVQEAAFHLYSRGAADYRP